MMSQNRSAQLDRVRDSSLHEKVDHIRLSQLLQLWETMQAQADDMQTLLRRWLHIQRVLRWRCGGDPVGNGIAHGQEWARVQMLQQTSGVTAASHASVSVGNAVATIPAQGGACRGGDDRSATATSVDSSQVCCPTCAAPWRSASAPPPWTTTMAGGPADSVASFAARHAATGTAYASGSIGNASGGSGENEEEHIDTQLDALQSSIEGTQHTLTLTRIHAALLRPEAELNIRNKLIFVRSRDF